MRNHVVLCLTLLLGAVSVAQEMPEMPKPTKEHGWLQHLVGEWESKSEVTMAPGQPPMKAEGSESVRSLGGFWIVAEGEASFMDSRMSSLMMLGYDQAKKKYVGTWVCSETGYLWKYEGSVDETGKKLTLQTEGPNPMDPAKQAKYREVIEIVDADNRTFTSYMQDDAGQWNQFMQAKYRRKA